MRSLFILILFFVTVWTLPIEYKTSAEEDMYFSAIEHYQNRVDIVLSSETEEFLIDLIHLPEKERRQVIEIQGNTLGIDLLSYSQRVKMPAIIGQHIHTMNNKVYDSVYTIITRHWSSLREQDVTLKLMYLNSLLAQELIEVIDQYNLLEKVKQDTLRFHRSYRFSWPLFQWPPKWLVTQNSRALELDFLSKYLSEIKAGLLLDLHSEFIPFLTRILDNSFDPLLENDAEY
ncbi:hypothetical protein BY458DRAFT_448516 [Sporodiniella umbellata]|nr:hypothetical protein BY458DRAFT_448516 [Sporodiniella umbellata]